MAPHNIGKVGMYKEKRKFRNVTIRTNTFYCAVPFSNAYCEFSAYQGLEKDGQKELESNPAAFNNRMSPRPCADPLRRHVELDGALQPSLDLTISNRFVQAVERENESPLVREGLCPCWAASFRALMLSASQSGCQPIPRPYQLICSFWISAMAFLKTAISTFLYDIFLKSHFRVLYP